MKFTELLSAVPGVITRPESDPEITGAITEDSRTIEPGGIFVAREGGSADGHRYIPQAVKAGAAAVVGEKPPEAVGVGVPYAQVEDAAQALAHLAAAYHGFPSRRLVMIGVTGTDGKTTTTSLVYSVLVAAGIRAGMITTINAVLGDESLDTGLHVTTPTAPEVQGYLARMVEAGLTHCVLEATSHGLAQQRVAAVDFDVAAVTNIQHEHLDFHGTWEGYRDAKSMLFGYLSAGERKPGVPKVAVINLDDEPSAAHLLGFPAEQRVTYSMQPASGADVSAQNVEYGPDATSFDLKLPSGESLAVRTRLVGAFNVSNLLAAAAVGVGLGLPGAVIQQGLEALTAIPGRMERIDEGQPFLAVVDFAHTPNALRRSLEAARLMIPPDGRVIAVFGSAGLRDPEKRALMGRIAAELADLTVITAEDPRTESLDAIMAASAEAARQVGGVEGETFWRVADRGEALYRAVQLARPGDLVLAFGKGHEQSMCFGTVEYPWDDREALRAALRGTPLKTLPTARPDWDDTHE